MRNLGWALRNTEQLSINVLPLMYELSERDQPAFGLARQTPEQALDIVTTAMERLQSFGLVLPHPNGDLDITTTGLDWLNHYSEPPPEFGMRAEGD
jgi:hypothetical protein